MLRLPCSNESKLSFSWFRFSLIVQVMNNYWQKGSVLIIRTLFHSAPDPVEHTNCSSSQRRSPPARPRSSLPPTAGCPTQFLVSPQERADPVPRLRVNSVSRSNHQHSAQMDSRKASTCGPVIPPASTPTPTIPSHPLSIPGGPMPTGRGCGGVVGAVAIR